MRAGVHGALVQRAWALSRMGVEAKLRRAERDSFKLKLEQARAKRAADRGRRASTSAPPGESSGDEDGGGGGAGGEGGEEPEFYRNLREGLAKAEEPGAGGLPAKYAGVDEQVGAGVK